MIAIHTKLHKRMTPKSNSAEIFVQCTYPPSFIILYLLVRKLSCWQTHPQTNKPTNAHRNRFRWKYPTFFTTLQRWVIIIFHM